MKLNYQIFKKLDREPDLIEQIEDQPYKIYFATDEEKTKIFRNDAFSVLTSDGKEIKLLVDKEAYEFEQNKEYFGSQLTALRMSLINDVTKTQRLTLFAVMLPITILFILATTLLLIFKNKFKNTSIVTVILVVLVILVFIASFLINFFTKKKIEKKHFEMQEKTKEILGTEKANELLMSINKFNDIMYARRQAAIEAKKQKKNEKANAEADTDDSEENK